jgi:cephalosporin hydroxylase
MNPVEIVDALSAQSFHAFWRGQQVAKSPLDLWVYQEIMFETKPDLLIETGSCIGGSALFFASIFDMLGDGHVVTVDKDRYPNQPKHPRITYVVGDSIDEGVISQVARLRHPSMRTMVALDSLHTYEQVKRELELYAPFVTPGCYLVVEDINPCLTQDESTWGTRAAREFVAAHPEFGVDTSREKFLITCNTNGWLRRLQ